jgi:hypothetical protein
LSILVISQDHYMPIAEFGGGANKCSSSHYVAFPACVGWMMQRNPMWQMVVSIICG